MDDVVITSSRFAAGHSATGQLAIGASQAPAFAPRPTRRHIALTRGSLSRGSAGCGRSASAHCRRHGSKMHGPASARFYASVVRQIALGESDERVGTPPLSPEPTHADSLPPTSDIIADVIHERLPFARARGRSSNTSSVGTSRACSQATTATCPALSNASIMRRYFQMLRAGRR